MTKVLDRSVTENPTVRVKISTRGTEHLPVVFDASAVRSEKSLRRLVKALTKVEEARSAYEDLDAAIEDTFNRFGYFYFETDGVVKKIVPCKWQSVKMKTLKIEEAGKKEAEAALSGHISEYLIEKNNKSKE